MLENGIACSPSSHVRDPLIVELGVFLDALLGFLVMQIFIYASTKRLRPSMSSSSAGSGTEGESWRLAPPPDPPVLSAALAAVVALSAGRRLGERASVLVSIAVPRPLGACVAGHVVTSVGGVSSRRRAVRLLGFGVSVSRPGAGSARLSGGEDYDAIQTRRFRILRTCLPSPCCSRSARAASALCGSPSRRPRLRQPC